MNHIIYPQYLKATDQLGGKAKALAALHHTNLSIPAWIALSPTAFYNSLGKAQRNALNTLTEHTDFSSLLNNFTPNPAVQAELKEALIKLCPHGEPVAVRSSALDEDGVQHSFAGQLDSFLFVMPQDVVNKVVEVWRSGFSQRILAYRHKNGLSLTPQAPTVLIQRMVNATVSGVAFSANPVTGQRDVAVVSALYGLGTALVSGEANADTYYVDRQGQIIERNIVTNQPALTDAQIQAVTDLAHRTEAFFGCPQDIEWAIEDKQLYLLQSRPITALPNSANNVLNLWDNSNIAESYPGVTTPLTFSFARRAYEEVYRQFCRMMGVPPEKIINHNTTFRRMLGFMQGRIYYNLLSWYKVLALLPGYKINRRFMEQMMGVKESLPGALLDQQTPPTQRARLLDGLYLLRSIMGLIVNYLFLPKRIANFYRRLNQALGTDRPDLSQLQANELVAYYRNLEQQLLTQWDAPLVNDFFAMIFYGLLRKLTETWCNDSHGTLQNSLLTNTGGIISAEPVIRIRHMAQLAVAHPAFVTTLSQGSLVEILAYIPQHPEFEIEYKAYLDKFGDRCLEELKLESPTLHDDPLLLLRSTGHLAQHNLKVPSQKEASKNLPSFKEDRKKQDIQTEQQIHTALTRHPLRRIIFNQILKNAHTLLRNRENLRFERTRLFGRARMIFVELGRKFHTLNLLTDPRDIFYLEVEEALGYVNGTTTTTNLKNLVALRKTEFEHHQAIDPPRGRFETRGIPSYNLNHQTPPPPKQPNPKSKIQNPKSLQGLGCSPGIVQGQVRVVTNPKTNLLQPGEILVAERTDPGWIMLFPIAAGLLTEYGSLLSHSAIVSREMGLPAIVLLPDITRHLKDGDWVEFDGSTGIVAKIEPPYA